MMGGMGMGSGIIVKDEKGKENLVTTVRQVGSKTFFRKGERWVDSVIKEEDEKTAVAIEQFSEKFFDLARSQSATMNQYLTFDEAVTVQLGDNVYRIDRAKN